MRCATTAGSTRPAFSRRGRGSAALGLVCAAFTALGAMAGARAEDTRFAVVDVTPSPEHDKLVAAVEAEVARLRPGARPIEDPVMRRLLATGEGPSAAAARLLKEAERRGRADDCEGAMTSARQAEVVMLTALSFDEERDQLKTIYTLMVGCAAKLGQAPALAAAAARLRALVSLPPSDLPPALWQEHVANATAGPATTELMVDSDPPNAQVAINFHGEGVTPRTLKVAPGTVYVEIQKDGFKKAFRALEVKDRPARVVMRLIARTQDRVEQAEAQLRVLSHGELGEHVRTLSTLSQLARVETLVLLSAADGKVRLWFFDAERGALSESAIESTYDAQTGQVAALAARGRPRAAAPAAQAPEQAQPQAQTQAQAQAQAQPQAPAAAGPALVPASPPAPGAAAPASPPAAAARPAEDVPEQPTEEALPEAKAKEQRAVYRPKVKRPGAPWWSWAIAASIAVAFGVFVFSDRAKEAQTVGVSASYQPQ